MSLPVLQIVIASTRPGRVGLPVATWIAERAREHGGFTVEVVDLAEIDLPIFNEPSHPKLGQYEYQHTKDWSTIVSRGDAFVFVIPEYNHSFNAAIKNALDYLQAEWAHKAVGFVSYGGVAAGTRAVQMLKPVVTALRMVPVVDGVNIPFIAQLIGEDGVLHANSIMDAGATAMLDELVRWTASLEPLRA